MLYFKRGYMKLTWYPVFLDPEAKPKVEKFIQKDLKKHNDLVLRVRAFLEAIKNVSTFWSYYIDVYCLNINYDSYQNSFYI